MYIQEFGSECNGLTTDVFISGEPYCELWFGLYSRFQVSSWPNWMNLASLSMPNETPRQQQIRRRYLYSVDRKQLIRNTKTVPVISISLLGGLVYTAGSKFQASQTG